MLSLSQLEFVVIDIAMLFEFMVEFVLSDVSTEEFNTTSQNT